MGHVFTVKKWSKAKIINNSNARLQITVCFSEVGKIKNAVEMECLCNEIPLDVSTS